MMSRAKLGVYRYDLMKIDSTMIWYYCTILTWYELILRYWYNDMVLNKCMIPWYLFDYDDAMRWLIDLIMMMPWGGLWTGYVHIYMMMMRWHEIMVLCCRLCRTTGPYGRTYVKATYGKTMIHSIEAVLGNVSSRKVVGVSSWCITTWSTYRVNTSVGLRICDFLWYKNLYVLCFQNLYVL